MTEPIRIGREICDAIHEESLVRFGGSAGIRDEGLLDSALNRPRHRFAYGCEDPFELAASYGVGIVKNHPYIDGNKRTGFLAAALFLELNGYRFQAPETEAVLQTLALAASEIDETQFSEWLARSCVAQ